MTGIILTGSTTEFEQSLREAYGASLNGQLVNNGELPDCSAFELVRGLAATTPHVVAVGPNVDIDFALEIAEICELERPDISVVLVLQPRADIWAKALRAGVRDIVEPTAEPEAIRAAFDRAIDVANRHRTIAPVPLEKAVPTCRTVVVVSPKGGSGKTTVASNLAVLLAKHQPDEVVLADFDLQFGDVANALRLEPEYTLAHATKGEPDSTMLKGFLTPHDSELLCLCAPNSPEEAEDISTDHLAHIVQQLQEAFSWLIIDTGAGLDDATLAMAELATDIVFISATDVASVTSLRKEIDIFDRIGITKATRHFVLNRSDARVGLAPEDIAASAGMEPVASIPSSGAVPLSMNQGEPISLSDPRSAVSRAMVTLSDSLAGRQVEANKGGIFRGLIK